VSISETFIINGWRVFAHATFLDQLEKCVIEVENIRKKNPTHYKEKNSTKRLFAITKLILEKIPQNPTLPEYRQGTTLGDEYKHWFRAKFFQQYRLFFRYHFESKVIVYGWVNDENTKRAYNHKSDGYQVFKKMLKKSNPPNDWDSLLKEAKKENERFKNLSKIENI